MSATFYPCCDNTTIFYYYFLVYYRPRFSIIFYLAYLPFSSFCCLFITYCYNYWFLACYFNKRLFFIIFYLLADIRNSTDDEDFISSMIFYACLTAFGRLRSECNNCFVGIILWGLIFLSFPQFIIYFSNKWPPS
jgi:hypothetical protein